jgi:hypothetical protein
LDLVVESVKKLETLIEHSGCYDSGVLLDVDPDAVNCRYERGACMTAEFGGKRGIFTTFDPVRARTKISFMFGATFDTPGIRGAACAIVNVSAGFFCLARAIRPCTQSSHAACGLSLAEELAGKKVFFLGPLHSLESLKDTTGTPDPALADIILIDHEGLIGTEAGNLIETYAGTKRIICAGPSTSGTARLNELEHWCPYGSG